MLRPKMLEPKFKIGQKVVAIHRVQDVKEVHVACDYCNSTGKIELKSADNDTRDIFECPACHGRTQTIKIGEKYKIWRRDLTIGKIQVEMYAPKHQKKHKSRVTYMLDETGVGNGSLWPEYELFATEEDANEFCEKYVPEEHSNKPVLKEN